MGLTLNQIISRLHELKDPEKVVFKMKKFGVAAENSLGVYHSDLKVLAKEIGMNSELAIELFETDIYECRLLCSKLFKPKDLTLELSEKWTATFENWEVCDSFSMGVYAKSPLAWDLINAWSTREAEYEKRASFATMAGYCLADKQAGNDRISLLLPLIENAAQDERIYVKKAVNWALRTIGKRNIDLNVKALACSQRLLESGDKAAIWIAKDAIKELSSPKVKMQDHPRAIYRP